MKLPKDVASVEVTIAGGNFKVPSPFAEVTSSPRLRRRP